MAPKASTSRRGSTSVSQTVFVGLLLLYVATNVVQLAILDMVLLKDHWSMLQPSTRRSSVSVPFGDASNGLPSSALADGLVPPELRSRGDGSLKSKTPRHTVAGLNCRAHGGPVSEEAVKEMVYWSDIRSDAAFRSPLATPDEEQYLTFEPDCAGWNNVRMAMETAVVFAAVTGRTLVLPPQQDLYMLSNDNKEHRKTEFTLLDFFHFDSVAAEHANLRVIPFEEFLRRVALTGQLRNRTSGQISFPPGNVTDWNGGSNWESVTTGVTSQLWNWLRGVVQELDWSYGQCAAAFPAVRGNEGGQRMLHALQALLQKEAEAQPGIDDYQRVQARLSSFHDNPTPVDASVGMRLREILADRQALCLYDAFWQNEKVIHLRGEGEYRLIVHFYAFFFFEDYHMDLWAKRFVRDHLRYRDEIQCAAARVVAAVRRIARNVSRSFDGSYDSIHIRRGDFQIEFNEMYISAEEIYLNNTSKILKEGRTVFVATDERSYEYFEPLAKHYHLLFLKDFQKELGDLDSCYYGMVDQLVASKGKTFIGTYYSTFSGYINRLRGYQAQKSRRHGYEQGIIDSYYLTPGSDSWLPTRKIMRSYEAVRQGFFMQEFPVAWRVIDRDAIGA